MTVPNSLVVIVPSPSLSNSENASLNSAICSSVSWSAFKSRTAQSLILSALTSHQYLHIDYI